MPNIASHQSAETTKLLLIADSGAGKSGSLAALAAEGYNLRILDFDNGLDVLKDFVTNPLSPYVKRCPEVARNIEFRTLTDPMKNLGGKLIAAKATVWERAMRMLDHWKYDGPDGPIDLGKVSSWTPQEILVLDSLTTLATGAHNFHLAMNGWLGTSRTSNESRRDIGAAQGLLRSLLELLYDSSIRCNVIVTAHITLVTELGGKPKNDEEGHASDPIRGFPSSIGRALSPHIPRYFNTVLMADVEGSGSTAKHFIYTKSRGNVLLKNTAPLRVPPKLPLETGLADYFRALRAESKS